MLNSKYLIEITIVSSIIGFLSEYFATIKLSFFILLAIIILDTLIGTFKAIRYEKFCSKGLSRLTKKTLFYSLAILTVRLLEIAMMDVFKTTLITQILIIYLIIVEAISILENLTLLGAPIPANFLPNMLKLLRIPGIQMIFNTNTTGYKITSEIDDIINYHLAIIENKELRKSLNISFRIWGKIINLINKEFNSKKYNNELLHIKIISLIQLGNKEIIKAWEDEEISRSTIEKINKKYNPKLEELQHKLKRICYSKDSIDKKKEQIISNIIIFLYQVIIEIRKCN